MRNNKLGVGECHDLIEGTLCEVFVSWYLLSKDCERLREPKIIGRCGQSWEESEVSGYGRVGSWKSEYIRDHRGLRMISPVNSWSCGKGDWEQRGLNVIGGVGQRRVCTPHNRSAAANTSAPLARATVCVKLIPETQNIQSP